ncbi:2-oxoglutarate and iron-dependent oxygenase domain-containing protein, partial [Roseibium sp.]|uniref:2-oxoglutarate and iron-dependent oxygenase domain-containing protein n=1 Tax=Roseibium sp. TaxID=1936156 RepID=UPI003D139220
MSGHDLPVIDLEPLISNAPGGLKKVAAEIGRTAREIGFFYVRNHGVDSGLMEASFAAA